jgi:uncharacterized protein YndB with AHSA1/START domain
MSTDTIQVSGEVPATPDRVYEAFVDPEIHAAMTGASATFETDGAFTAWDGYITGRTLEAHPGQSLVQAWRTTQFPKEAADSVLEIRFQASPGGTRVTFDHREIPEGQGANYREGWVDHYLVPLRAWFQQQDKAASPRD